MTRVAQSDKEKPMARAHIAYLARADVPARAPLQAAIDALKLKLTLDDAYAPFETSGYLPCTLNGEDAGFTLKFETAPAEPSAALAALLAGRDAAMSFRWSGDVREHCAALIVSVALAEKFGALLFDPEKDAAIESKKLLAKARELTEEM
jgi:hypothetical protein